MRALEHRPQLTQMHLNQRRIFQFFTRTKITGSQCPVHFQIISQHTQHSSTQTHCKLNTSHPTLNPRFPLDPHTPFHKIINTINHNQNQSPQIKDKPECHSDRAQRAGNGMSNHPNRKTAPHYKRRGGAHVPARLATYKLISNGPLNPNLTIILIGSAAVR
ncbi:hypothetical protein HG66A1_15180 [Gimesia chilikensis]|uniref:Uncharacterized protein n=1 Tax=Gimesia chilikensis TaxID=2605989 RepID=A0A517PK44_9PLAN|nr:hypothetical protein HG66A1_15180 [Gimesia chilikensis]